MMKRLALGLLTLAACLDAGDPAPELGEATDELVFDQGYLWPKDDLTVCWDDSAYDDPDTPDVVDDVYLDEREWVREIVTSNWGRLSRLELRGWARCSQTTNPDIRVGNVTLSSSYAHIGTSGLSKTPSMKLNLGCVVPRECTDFDADDPPPEDPNGGYLALCKGFMTGRDAPPNKRVCVQTIALHEFGHAIGLRHEHAHPDSTCTYSEGLDGTDAFGTVHDGEPFGGFDPESIMSYCKAYPTQYGQERPRISDGDVAKINMLYPSPPMLFTTQNLASFPMVFGPGTFEVVGTFAAQARSLLAPPGYIVKLCNATGCYEARGIAKTLPAWIDQKVTRVIVETQALAYVDPGLRGTKAWYPPGKYLAVNSTLKLPNDQLSSLWTPHGLAMTICRHEGSAPNYDGLECARFEGSPSGDNLPAVKLSSYDDNDTSFIEVSSFVQLYGDVGFRNADRGALVPRLGAYLDGEPFDFDTVRSWLIPQNLEVTACTGVGDGVTGTGCQRATSGDIPASLHGQITLIKVREPPTYTWVPPCPDC